MSAAGVDQPSSVDLLYSEVEEQLRASVRQVLTDRADAGSVLRRLESDEPYDPVVWTTLSRDLGVAGLAVTEDLGGSGATWREVAVVAEELGRACCGTPFLGSAMAVALLQAAGDTGLLTAIASADRTASVAASIAGTPHAVGRGLTVADGRLSGSVPSVIDAVTTDVLLVPVRDGDERQVVAVDRGAAHISDVVSLDLTRPLRDIAFDRAPFRVVAEGDAADRAVVQAWRVGSVLLAAEQVGLAQQCLDMTVAYLKSRHQFGRPIGGYQALKHRAADLWAAIAQARAVSRYAVGCLAVDGHPDSSLAASLAQAFCSPVAVRAAEECVQLHGGIGFTWEHPAHVYLKRAKADSLLFGSAAVHRARLGGLVGLPAS